jgi:hypothetical protein
VLQDVSGIRRVPGKRQEVSTPTAYLFKLCSVFRCVPVVHTSDTVKSRTFLVITSPREGLRLDVRLVSLCYNALVHRTAAASLPAEYRNRSGGVVTGKIRMPY